MWCSAALKLIDAICRHRSGSTLAQVMPWCLTAPSHYIDFSSVRSSGIHLRAISLEIHQPPFTKVSLKTSTGIDADASKGETSPGYFNSKLVHSYKCGTICPWEFPEISLAYSHIFLKGHSRPIIYGKIFWPPHIASPASIYHQNQLSFVFRLSFHLTIHFENVGNICNKYDL